MSLAAKFSTNRANFQTKKEGEMARKGRKTKFGGGKKVGNINGRKGRGRWMRNRMNYGRRQGNRIKRDLRQL